MRLSHTTAGAVDSRQDSVLVAAKAAIERHPYLTSEEVSELLAGSPSGHHLAQLRRHGSVLGLRVARRGYFYPSFQFDSVAGRIEPTVAKANRILMSHREVPSAILWWFEPAGHTARPLELFLGGQSALVIELARQM